MATKPRAKMVQRDATLDDLLKSGTRYQQFAEEHPEEAPPPEPSSMTRRVLGDGGIALAKGVIGVPEAAVGLADLATGGAAGKFLENEGGAIGFRPKMAKQILDTWKSPEQQAADKAVQEAQGFVDTTVAALKNPSVVLGSVAESAPMMLGGGVIARSLLRMAPARMAGAAAAPVVAGAAGEGIVTAGSQAEIIRQETPDGLLTGEQAGLAAASGLATGMLGYMGGKIAQKLGIADIDTILAGKGTPEVTKGFTRRVLEGAAAEGLLEELPQSVQEQVAQNMALGKPLGEGVPQAAVLGALAGGLMGGGGNAISYGGQVRREKVDGGGPASKAINAGLEDTAQQADAIQAAATPPVVDPLAAAGAAAPAAAAPTEPVSMGAPIEPAAMPPEQPAAEPAVPRPITEGRKINLDGKDWIVTTRPQGGYSMTSGSETRSVPAAAKTGKRIAELLAGGPSAPVAPTPAAAPGVGFTEAFDGLKGGGVTDNLYQGLFDALSKGEDTFKGVKDTVLANSKAAFAAGKIKTPADLRAHVEAGYPAPVSDSQAFAEADIPLPDESAPPAPMDATIATPVEPAAVAAPEAGAPTPPAADGAEWQTFGPETGTKSVPRADMPQIRAEHRGAMVQFLKGRGILHEQEAEVEATSLKPTQAEYSVDKVLKAREFTGGNRAILVSNDGHVLDGHHQWLAAATDEKPLRVIRLDAPIDRLLAEVKEFPSATTDTASAPTTPEAGFIPAAAPAPNPGPNPGPNLGQPSANSAQGAETIIEHVTGKGKTLRGVIRRMPEADAKAMDPGTFKKNGGWFIRASRAGLSPERLEEIADTPLSTEGTNEATRPQAQAAGAEADPPAASAAPAAVATGAGPAGVEAAGLNDGWVEGNDSPNPNFKTWTKKLDDGRELQVLQTAPRSFVATNATGRPGSGAFGTLEEAKAAAKPSTRVDAPAPAPAAAPGVNMEAWWEKSLTPAGRHKAMLAAGMAKGDKPTYPDTIRWQYLPLTAQARLRELQAGGWDADKVGEPGKAAPKRWEGLVVRPSPRDGEMFVSEPANDRDGGFQNLATFKVRSDGKAGKISQYHTSAETTGMVEKAVARWNEQQAPAAAPEGAREKRARLIAEREAAPAPAPAPAARVPYPPAEFKGAPAYLEPAQRAVVDHMNGDLTLEQLHQRFADLDMAQGAVSSVTNRIDWTRADDARVQELRKPAAPAPAPAPKPADMAGFDAANDAEMALRKLAHADKRPGDVELGNGKFVTMEQAMTAARQAMTPEQWKMPFQFNRALDIASVDWNRMVQAMTGAEYRDPTKGNTTDSEREAKAQPAPGAALLQELRTKLSALADRAQDAMAGKISGQIRGFTIGMKPTEPYLTRAWVDEVVAERERMVARAEKAAAKQAPAPAPTGQGSPTLAQQTGQGSPNPGATDRSGDANPDAAAKAKALSDLNDALGDLAGIFGKDFKANMLPEQEQKLMPVLTRVMDAAFRAGYYSFKQAARFVLDTIRERISPEVADAISLDQLQGSYIAMAGKYKDQGATSKRDVVAIESLDELAAEPAASPELPTPAAVPAQSPASQPPAATQGAQNDPDAAPALDQPSPPALAGVPAGPVQGPDGERAAGDSAAPGGRIDGGGNGRADGAGRDGGRGLRAGEGTAPVPATGAGGSGAAGADRGVSGGAEPAADAAGVQRPVAPPEFARKDFRITDETRLGEGGPKAKYRQNVEAIRLINELERTGRPATVAEQNVLARYVGWGALSQAFDPDHKDWTKEYAELKELLTADEWAAAFESTQYAHYTSEQIVVDGIYAAVRRMGFTGGKTLEMGGGVGNFIGLMPEDLKTGTRFTLIERERISARIAKHLYPEQNVQLADATEFRGNDDYYDLAPGNPPFASTPLTDISGRKHLSGLSVHNYFFAKSVDMLRPGGILAQVVSNSFMDAGRDRARRYIGERTKLLGAIRLPNNAFAKNAGTEVTTDLIFLQKLPEAEWGTKAAREASASWADLVDIPDPAGGKPIPVNRYFAEHPEMMLGEMGRKGTMYRADMPALVARPGQDMAALLKEAVGRLPADVYVPPAVAGTSTMMANLRQRMADPGVEVGGFFERAGKLYQRGEDEAGEAMVEEITPATQWTEKTTLGDIRFDRIKQLAGMRVTLRALIAAEMEGGSRMQPGVLRTKLNEQYDAYVKDHGLINDKPTIQAFGDDPDFPLLASLENDFKPGMGAAAAKSNGIKPFKASAKKAPIFSRSVVAARRQVATATTPADALAVSMAERGRIDAAYMSQLLGKDAESILAELASGERPLLFKDPASNEYVLRDAYLSGNVRKKLDQAKAANMFGNARALEEVQPADVGVHEIHVRIGSPWVPTKVYEDFAKEIFGDGTQARIGYLPMTSGFMVTIRPGSEVAQTNTFGTTKMGGTEILEALLNNRAIKITYTSEGKTYTDKEGTEAANLKAGELRDKFQDWAFADPDRAEVLGRSYNDENNNYVTRQYDGNMMTFPGKVPDEIIKFRKHQRNAIARIVQDRTTLLDHVVGAGKTYTVIAGAMELKRTGLAKKSMITVPNHLVKQWAADFYRLYPGANILAATKKDFQGPNRRRFLARIATGDWDAVILAHSSYGFIAPAAEFEQEFNQRQVADIMATIQAVKNDGDEKDLKNKRRIKALAKMKEGLEQRIKSLRDRPMDSLLDFGQLGVDQLFVDEAHLFKNLMFSTKMQGVSGLGDGTGSQRAYDMYVKTQQVMEANGRGQGVVFATGTPISNSLAEMYHMQRYLMPTAMVEGGFQSFDAWANTYASVDQVWMQKISGDGFKVQNRMSTFVNTPELLKMFDQVSDTVTMDDIKKAYAEENDGAEFPLPKLKTGRRQPVSLGKSAGQEAYMLEIAKRAKALEVRRGPPKKGDDNHLTVMGDARKAAMDIRLVDPSITQREAGGRIDRASDEVVERYKKYDAQKGTQIVFSDLGTPLKHAKAELAEYAALKVRADRLEDEALVAAMQLGDKAAAAALEDAQDAADQIEAKGADWLDAAKAAERGFSVYDDFRAALIEKGIPAEEIAFIHDFNTDDQKAALFRKVNAGQIRVLMGSTPKLGAGTNVQDRLVALHHLDVPWKPSDVEQREGRIVRQGNLLATVPTELRPNPLYIDGFEVEILAYVTRDTLDMRMWQIQEAKLKMINQLRERKVGREVDNAFQDMEMSAGEMQAAATGNIDLLREIQLKNDVKLLEQKKRAFDAQRSDLASRRKAAQAQVDRLPKEIAQLKPWAQAFEAYQKSMQEARPVDLAINGKRYTDRTAAQDVLRELTQAHEQRLEERRAIVKANNGAELTEADRAAHTATIAAQRALGTADGALEADRLAKLLDTIKPVPKMPKLAIEFNGETYGSTATVAEAFVEAAGDASRIDWLYSGKTITRRTNIPPAILPAVSKAMKTDTEQSVGSFGPYTVVVEGGTRKGGGRSLDVQVTLGGDTRSRDVSVQVAEGVDPGLAAAGYVESVAMGVASGASSRMEWAESDLKRAQKTLAELEATAAPEGAWPGEAELERARAAHREVLKRLASGGTAPLVDDGNGGSTNLAQTGSPAANDTDVVFADLSRVGDQIARQGYERADVKRMQAARRLQGILADKAAGKLTPEEFDAAVAALADQMADVSATKQANRLMAERQRGADMLRVKLINGRRTGDLDEDAVGLGLWLLDKNPSIASDLSMSILAPKDGGPAGDYNPVTRVIRLFKDAANADTIAHEILHHAERMMPPELQAPIRAEYAKQLEAGLKAAKDQPQVLEALQQMLKAAAGSNDAYAQTVKNFKDGVLDYGRHYQLFNQSEFWAVNGARILSGRYGAQGSWVAQARQWLADMVQYIRGALGLRSDAPVLRALANVTDPGNFGPERGGDFMSEDMLSQGDDVRQSMPSGIRSGTEEEARAAGFTMKAYRGVSAANPFNDTGTTWLTTSREVAEAYAEEVMGYDDPAVLEVMVNPGSLPRHDASRLTDEQREAMGADDFGNPQAVGIYDRSDDHPLGGSRGNVTVIHAPKEAVFVLDGGQTYASLGFKESFSKAGASLRDVHLPANYRVGDFFNTDGRISWWHKTVGTMHNLAARSPLFKRTYDAVQNFVNDVSFYATEAANEAPRILPKLDKWRDVFKSPLSPEQAKAIAAPIFEGTLTWARDISGKPVKVFDLEAAAAKLDVHQKAQELLRRDMVDPRTLRMWQGLPMGQYESIIETKYAKEALKPGLVWRDSELKSMFGLTEGEDGTISLYREARRAIDKSLNNLAIADMLRLGGDDVATMREKVLASGDPMKAAVMLRDRLYELAAEQPDRANVLNDTGNRMIDKADQVGDLKKRGYAPLSRFGQYTLDVVDDAGERVYFGLFESAAERAKMARQMRENFPGASIESGTVSQEEYRLFAGVSPETLELFGEFLGLEADGDNAASKAFQTYIKLTKSTRSAMKRLIERKGIDGFSEDVGRVLAGFVYSNARQTSSSLHQGEIAESVAAFPKGPGQMKDAAVQLMEYVKNPQEEAQAIRGMLFAQYLGGSVASALVNMTQPATVTLPYLSQFGGAGKAAKRVAGAARIVNKESTGDAALDRALKVAEETGVVSPQEVHQLQAQAMGRATLRTGDGTKTGDAYAKGMNKLAILGFAWGKLFGMAEQVNRRITFIAAYRTAVDEGMRDPAKFATQAVTETQFTYNKGNKPKWARGAVGSVLFTFKQYSISYLELMNRMWNAGDEGSPERAAGRKAVLLAMAVLFLAGGADGLPFMEDAEDVLDAFMQRLGYNFSSKQARHEFLADVLGDGGARFVTNGLSGLPGAPLDVSGRMGMGNMIPGTGLLPKKADHTRDATEVIGPMGDFAKRSFEAVGKLVDGEPIKAVQTIAPVAARNAAKAVDMASTGMYRDDRGRKVIDVDGYDALIKGLGFQPNDVARVQESAGMVQNLIAQNKLREAEIADKWAIGIFEGDQGKQAEARAELARWNDNNPTAKIKIEMPQVLKRVRAMRQSKAERLEKTAPREIRAQVKAELAGAGQ